MSKLTSMMLAPLATAALCVPVLSPVSAQEPIVVESREAMKQFQKEVSKDLNRNLEYAGFRNFRTPNTGFVKIQFTLDDSGKPADFKVVANTSDYAGERTARYAVARLRGLDQAPVRNAHSAQFQANIAFAQDEYGRREVMAEMQRDERARFARGEVSETLIVLGS